MLRRTIVSAAALALLLAARPLSQGAAAVYTLYTSAGRRALPFRTSGNADMVSLEQLASLFSLTLAEDTLVGGLTVQTHGQPILLIPGQSFASIGPGRVISLSAPVQHERNGWQVPVDFIRLALGPALNLPVDIRRQTHVIVVGTIRVPTIGGRLDRQGPAARLTLDVEPATPHHVTVDAAHVVIRFDATALDLAAFTGLAPDVTRNVHADGSSLVIDLGPAAGTARATDVDETHVAIDFGAPAAASAPAPAPTPAAPAPAAARPQPPITPGPSPAPLDLGAPGALRTVVIDPGHGGDDDGVHGLDGAKEKDLTLQIAGRLKTAIETRIGLRVLLTRDADANVPLDQRASLANNNKADLFISLHANASMLPDVHGVQVASLAPDAYKGRVDDASVREPPVPVVTGGTRAIEIVPWDVAQVPFARRSAAVAGVLVRELSARNVPLFSTPAVEMPLRPLVSANMPAILIEMGFLTNSGDEQALAGPERSNAIIDAIVATIEDLRGGIAEAPAPAGGARP